MGLAAVEKSVASSGSRRHSKTLYEVQRVFVEVQLGRSGGAGGTTILTNMNAW
jgi:hypothetical protein